MTAFRTCRPCRAEASWHLSSCLGGRPGTSELWGQPGGSRVSGAAFPGTSRLLDSGPIRVPLLRQGQEEAGWTFSLALTCVSMEDVSPAGPRWTKWNKGAGDTWRRTQEEEEPQVFNGTIKNCVASETFVRFVSKMSVLPNWRRQWQQ